MNEQTQHMTELEHAFSVLKTHGYRHETESEYRERKNLEAAVLGSPATMNDRGEWVQAIPLPYFLAFGRVRCECGEIRWGQHSYREHYALAHVMGMSS